MGGNRPWLALQNLQSLVNYFQALPEGLLHLLQSLNLFFNANQREAKTHTVSTHVRPVMAISFVVALVPFSAVSAAAIFFTLTHLFFHLLLLFS